MNNTSKQIQVLLTRCETSTSVAVSVGVGPQNIRICWHRACDSQIENRTPSRRPAPDEMSSKRLCCARDHPAGGSLTGPMAISGQSHSATAGQNPMSADKRETTAPRGAGPASAHTPIQSRTADSIHTTTPQPSTTESDVLDPRILRPATSTEAEKAKATVEQHPHRGQHRSGLLGASSTSSTPSLAGRRSLM